MKRRKKAFLVFAVAAAAALCSLALAACGGAYIEKMTVKGKTDYMVGEAFAGATLTVNYSDGARKTVDVTDDMISGFDTSVAGSRAVTVTYRGKIATLDITVTELYASGIAVDPESKAEYLVGGSYADGDARIVITYTDGNAQTLPVTADMVSGLDTSTEGEKTVAVNYGRLAASYTVNVRLPRVTAATVASSTRTKYRVGDGFGGATLDVEYEDGTSGSVTITDGESISGFDTQSVGTRTVRVAYRNRTVDYDIEVLKAIASVVVTGGTRLYAIGDTFKGAALGVEYADGSTETLQATEEMLTGFDTSTGGEKTVKLDFEGRELSFAINVYGKLVEKIQVEDGNYVDMSGAQSQSGGSKFESTTTNAAGDSYSNGAEGSSTAGISVAGNKITIRFIADEEGKYKFGMRAQSGSNSGKSDVAVADAFDISVNGAKKTASGTIGKGSATNTNWKDMTLWTLLDDVVGEIDAVEGLNEIELAFKGGTAQTMRFPNIDYFLLTAV